MIWAHIRIPTVIKHTPIFLCCAVFICLYAVDWYHFLSPRDYTCRRLHSCLLRPFLRPPSNVFAGSDSWALATFNVLQKSASMTVSRFFSFGGCAIPLPCTVQATTHWQYRQQLPRHYVRRKVQRKNNFGSFCDFCQYVGP